MTRNAPARANCLPLLPPPLLPRGQTGLQSRLSIEDGESLKKRMPPMKSDWRRPGRRKLRSDERSRRQERGRSVGNDVPTFPSAHQKTRNLNWMMPTRTMIITCLRMTALPMKKTISLPLCELSWPSEGSLSCALELLLISMHRLHKTSSNDEEDDPTCTKIFYASRSVPVGFCLHYSQQLNSAFPEHTLN
jgi:hypothetical protein